MKSYIVIGSGILGASTAYHLATSGAQVTLIDRKDRGQATEAAAGIVCPWLTQRRNKAWYFLAKNGAKYYPDLIRRLEQDGETETGYSRVGAISLHHDHSKLEKMVERAKKRREDAPEIGDITLLSHTETRSMFPPLSDEYAAVHVSGGARVNGQALRDALIRAAEKHGAVIHNGDAKLIREENEVTGVEVNGNLIEADQVIVTAGAWAKELFEPFDIELMVRPQKAQIVHLDMPNVDTANWPVVMPPNNQYLLSFGGGKVVIGATHEDDVGYDMRPTVGGIHDILHKALTIAPGLSKCTVVETKVGFRPFTPGFLPVIGSLPSFNNMLFANGLGASGLTVGPYLGSELANLALGEPLEIDMNDYDVREAIKLM
ncbi:NAD(P)/FAD-dependent oxidoreductase [Evansella halocellulosilytica]|uniref:NAD(P)/FAD-dependent oxidoreductase n=1 Tax=Evansella halocellulosilytica TaxID=2011013 RepID=UPI000BB859A0|nr:FAD-binding oxidoreductase [Evansella halocellulosilytica]